MQQSSQHVLHLSWPQQEQPHGSRQQLHLHCRRRFAPDAVDEALQGVGGARDLLPIHAQQPQQGLFALVQTEEEELRSKVN